MEPLKRKMRGFYSRFEITLTILQYYEYGDIAIGTGMHLNKGFYQAIHDYMRVLIEHLEKRRIHIYEETFDHKKFKNPIFWRMVEVVLHMKSRGNTFYEIFLDKLELSNVQIHPKNPHPFNEYDYFDLVRSL